MYNKSERIKLFDALSRPILVIDLNYRIVDANPAACTLLRRPYDRIIGQACHQISHRNKIPCWETGATYCPVKLSMENGRAMRVVHKHQHDSPYKIEEIVATPVFDTTGNLIYVIEELRDISQLLQPQDAPSSPQIIPVCAACKKIRDDRGCWQPFEHYLGDRLQARFSHSICPECQRAHYPELKGA